MTVQEILDSNDKIHSEEASKIRSELLDQIEIPDPWEIVDEPPQDDQINEISGTLYPEDWAILQLYDGEHGYVVVLVIGNANLLQAYIDDEEIPFKEPTSNPETIRRQLLR